MRISCPASGMPQETKRSARGRPPPRAPPSRALERLALDGVDQRRPRRAAGRRRRASSRRGRRPGESDARPEAVGREALGEAAQRLRAHRLGAVQRHAPGGEVEPGDLLVGDLVDAQLVGEVGRRRQRAAVAVDRPQPARRAGEEGERRHQHQRHAEVERAHPAADQPHVVVERQPAHDHVVRPDVRPLADRPQVRQQVGVGEHHPLGIAGAAGGELEEGDVLRRAPAAAGRSAPRSAPRASATVATHLAAPGSWAPSRRARVRTSEKVTSTSAPAVRRMPAWRRRWSSIWLLRAGG